MEFSNEQYEYCFNALKKYIPEDALKECLQETLLIICEMNFKDTPENTCKYVIRSTYTNYFSNTSSYAYKFRNKRMNDLFDISIIEEEIPEEPSEIDDFDIFSAIDQVKTSCWWEKEVVKRKILEDKTFKELAEEYNLSVNQVVYSYYKTIRNIKKSIEDGRRY